MGLKKELTQSLDLYLNERTLLRFFRRCSTCLLSSIMRSTVTDSDLLGEPRWGRVWGGLARSVAGDHRSGSLAAAGIGERLGCRSRSVGNSTIIRGHLAHRGLCAGFPFDGKPRRAAPAPVA